MHFFIEHEKKLFYEDSQITDLSLRLSKILGGNKHDTVIGEPFVVQVATVNMAVPDFAIKVSSFLLPLQTRICHLDSACENNFARVLKQESR